MVMNTENQLDDAQADYSRGFFGRTWDHRLTDDEWREASRIIGCRIERFTPRTHLRFSVDDLDLSGKTCSSSAGSIYCTLCCRVAAV